MNVLVGSRIAQLLVIEQTDLKALEARGAQLAKVDYADQESLKAALVDVEVLYVASMLSSVR